MYLPADLGLGLGEAWRRDNGIVAALAASPAASAFFDSLATFYRKGYLRWINATTRRPDVRAACIAEMISLLEQGKKQR
ncbi:YdeI/OmpD-associated family protein [Amycolatopsis sp. NPDC059657]|uniref:YdeI/OmpD-associated family protein n=1 Tax=Amycolatopsis sp. NPDC059657 TaxID=3346899 RepID=UPI00366CB697